MKILQIVSGRFVNGAMVHVSLLARELASRGHEIHLLCRPRSWIWRNLSRSSVQRRKSEMNRMPPNELIKISRWVREEEFDVIHTHMSRAHFFGVLLRKTTGVPCVATAHASHFQLHWPFNDLVIANSESTKEFQARFNLVPRGKLTTIPCFIDLQKFTQTSPKTREYCRNRFGIHDDRPLIGVIGAVLKRKGQRELVEALPELVRRFPNLKLAFIGQIEFKERYFIELKQRVEELKLQDHVIWVGRRNNVHELIQSLDACVVPSLKEPLGLCALEAMAAGVPVVAAKVGGLKEFVRQEETGLLFDPRQPQDIANKTARMLTDSELRSYVQQKAKQMVLDEFSPSAITDRIEQALISTTLPGKQLRAA